MCLCVSAGGHPRGRRCLSVHVSSACPSSVDRQAESLCALDALEATEVPAFLQTGPHAAHFLPEGAGQPREKSLHLAGVDLQVARKKRLIDSILAPE